MQVAGATIDGGDVSIFSDATTNRFAGYDVFDGGLTSYIAGQTTGNTSDPTDTTLTFADRTATAGATITRSQGSWISDGFQVGQEIITVGTAYNDNVTYTIASVSPEVITLVPTDFLTPETDDGTATVKELLSSVLPQNLPVETLDQNGNPVDSSIPVSQLARPVDALTGLYQQVDLDGYFPVFEGVTSSATTAIQILSSAAIIASGNVDIETSSTSDAEVDTPSFILGGAYASSDGYATTTIGEGVQIKAAGNFTLKSLVTNTMAAQVEVSSGLVQPVATLLGNGGSPVENTAALKIPGPSISVAYGTADSISYTLLASGASVQAAAVTIDSQNNNSFQAVADSSVIAPGIYNPKSQGGTGNNQGSGARGRDQQRVVNEQHRGRWQHRCDRRRFGHRRVAQQYQ